jgi:hypothetical protein
MAALAGVGVGGAIGGIIGALIGMGIPEYEAKRGSQSNLNWGKTVRNCYELAKEADRIWPTPIHWPRGLVRIVPISITIVCDQLSMAPLLK